MSLAEGLWKIKGFMGLGRGRTAMLAHAAIVLFVGAGAYLLGVISVSEKGREFTYVQAERPDREVLGNGDVRQLSAAAARSSDSASGPTSGAFVASRQGTKYHRKDCSGAKTIKPENAVYFFSESEARSAGYLPAANCPGLER